VRVVASSSRELKNTRERGEWRWRKSGRDVAEVAEPTETGAVLAEWVLECGEGEMRERRKEEERKVR
jgi:hypothetical protein